ncbi:RTX toxin [Archangium sp.]|jgi:alpha-tubulin suppressor-like RCC1 family protein|uniref:RCC1 domain-containing protein n=1 Tax=Archangium sp. TaxID=1872627 RepID=UPI002ED82F22
MKNPPLCFRSTRGTLRKAAVLLSALTFGIAGCNPTEPQGQVQEQEDTATASFSIKNADLYDSASGAQGRVLSARALTSAQAFTFSDVTRLRIDVLDKDANAPIYINFDLALSAGEWTGKIPFLPKNKLLSFSAKALNSSGDVLFKGTTEQTFTKSGSVVIALGAANDGQTISIPRIKKISVPSAFGSDQSGNVSFSVEANTGDTLSYEITSEAGSGTFFPTSGTITLLGTAGTFVSQYTPPTVSANTDFQHTVKVSNEAGHSVTTTFKTKVKPPGQTDGVRDNVIEVRFNPVINSLSASRLTGSNSVLFHADVADDDDVSALTYAWSLAATGGTTLDPSVVKFTSPTNPTTLQGYTVALQAEITLEVTDSVGGKTTLKYPLAANQFPDNPVVEGGLTGINSIRAGEAHTCVLFNNGNMRCWGENAFGQLGQGNTLDIGDTQKPSAAKDIALVGVGARIAVGGKHSCALLDTGLVRCWGNNEFGQLGYNTTQHVGDGEAIASYGYVNLGGVAVKLAAGYEHTCALMDTGRVRCWGHNDYGQLGYGHTDDIGDDEQPYSEGDVEVTVEEGRSVKNIVAGGHHTCALLDNGNVRCWGYNGYGQLGYGNTKTIGDAEQPYTAGDVTVGGAVVQLTAGENHTCALLETGNVRCWGYNGYGQLGYDHAGSVYSPTSTSPAAGDVNMGGYVLQVAAGKTHTCALLGTGDIKCWGNGANGRLGYGSTSSRLKPSTAVDLDGSSAYQVTAGGSHTCALLSTGAARCWGENGSGQLGYGNKEDIGDTELASAGGDIELIKP